MYELGLADKLLHEGQPHTVTPQMHILHIYQHAMASRQIYTPLRMH